MWGGSNVPPRIPSRTERSGGCGLRDRRRRRRAADRSDLIVTRVLLVKRGARVPRIVTVVDRSVDLDEPEVRLTSVVGLGIIFDDVLEVQDRRVRRLTTRVM